MKKLLIAMIITGMGYCGANAQTSQINVCGVKHDKVCRLSADKKNVSCYKTKYAENFKVCKNDAGYFICCETPEYYNSTFPVQTTARVKTRKAVNNEHAVNNTRENNGAVDMTIPQSQSYVMTSTGTYQGYYPKKGKIKVCYVGDNVALNSRAPYEGCESPQFDGPEANNYRNMNVSNPVDLPPISGRSQE